MGCGRPPWGLPRALPLRRALSCSHRRLPCPPPSRMALDPRGVAPPVAPILRLCSRSFSECSHLLLPPPGPLEPPPSPRSLPGALAPSPVLSLHCHCPSHRPPHALSTRLLGHVSPWGQPPAPLLSLLIPHLQASRGPWALTCAWILIQCSSASTAALSSFLKAETWLVCHGVLPLWSWCLHRARQPAPRPGFGAASWPRHGSPFPVVTAHLPQGPRRPPICFLPRHLPVLDSPHQCISRHVALHPALMERGVSEVRAYQDTCLCPRLSSAPHTPPWVSKRPCHSPCPNHVLLTPDSPVACSLMSSRGGSGSTPGCLPHQRCAHEASRTPPGLTAPSITAAAPSLPRHLWEPPDGLSSHPALPAPAAPGSPQGQGPLCFPSHLMEGPHASAWSLGPPHPLSLRQHSFSGCLSVRLAPAHRERP